MATVLICDDDVFFTRLVKDLVTRLGHRPVTVNTAPAALERVRTEAPALLVTDLMMKGMDGLELCRQIRADPATRSLPVIMMSSRDAPDYRAASVELEVLAFLPKPFEVEEMGARIRNILNASQEGPGFAPPAGCLAGQLEHIELPVLVQRLNLQRKSGCLSIDADAGDPAVKIWFVDGQVHSVASEGAVGSQEALARLQGRRTGAFLFDALAVLPPERDLHLPFMEVVLLLAGD